MEMIEFDKTSEVYLDAHFKCNWSTEYSGTHGSKLTLRTVEQAPDHIYVPVGKS